MPPKKKVPQPSMPILDDENQPSATSGEQTIKAPAGKKQNLEKRLYFFSSKFQFDVMHFVITFVVYIFSKRYHN